MFVLFKLSSTETESRDKNIRFCTSKSCEKESKWILGKINSSVDPCVDFYTFACGNYIKTHQLPNNTHEYDEMEMLRKKLEREINGTFYKNYDDTNDILSLSKRFYLSCIDLGA